MRFIILLTLFVALLVAPFLLLVSPGESLTPLMWLSIPTWPLHGLEYSDNLFDLIKPTSTLLMSVCLAVASACSRILFATLMIVTAIASAVSAFWLNYLINAS